MLNSITLSCDGERSLVAKFVTSHCLDVHFQSHAVVSLLKNTQRFFLIKYFASKLDVNHISATRSIDGVNREIFRLIESEIGLTSSLLAKYFIKEKSLSE